MVRTEPTFYIREGDTQPIFEAQLLDQDGSPISLSNVTVKLRMTPDVEGEMSIEDDKEGIVAYYWQEGDTDTPGTHTANIVVEGDSGQRQTFPSAGNILVKVLPKVKLSEG